MTNDQRKTTPPSWASLYGDPNADLNVFEDLDGNRPTPKRSSAARHARQYDARTDAIGLKRDLLVVAEAAATEAGELALAEATKLIRAGKKVPPELARRAAAVAKSKGVGVRSSAEEHAHRYRTRS